MSFAAGLFGMFNAILHCAQFPPVEEMAAEAAAVGDESWQSCDIGPAGLGVLIMCQADL